MPVYDKIEVRTFISMMAMQIPSKERVNFAIVEEEPDIVKARNKAIATIMNSSVPNPFSLWIDSDVAFPPDGIIRLMEVMTRQPEAGIITGLYRGRTHPHEVVVFDYIDTGKEFGFIAGYKEGATEEYEISACGAGFMLVRNQVFIDGCAFDKVLAYSEDISFCIRVREAGYKIFATPNVKCLHVAKTLLGV